MADIDNCPHCGGKAELKDIQKPGKYRHGWVGCPACGIYKNWNHSPDEAIRIWNRRADDG